MDLVRKGDSGNVSLFSESELQRAGDLSSLDPLGCALFLIVAFSLAGAFHTVWLTTRLSRRFATPLDGGLIFRGQRLLGDNKTLRGFLVMVPATGATFFVLALLTGAGPSGAQGLWELSPTGYAMLGLWAGFGFMAGELPNSFVKRRFGIPPGGFASGRMTKLIFLLLDRVDSIAGMLLALTVFVPTPWQTWLYVVLIGPLIHLGFSALLFLVGVKSRFA